MTRRRLFHLGLWGPLVDDGADWEIEHHISERIDQLVASGLTREDAELEARRAFGNAARVRRELRGIDRDSERRMRFGLWLETVVQDIQYGLRGVRREPGFALALTLTLGLGIGANVAMFSVLDALLLRPLPFPAPRELVTPWTVNEKGERQQPYFSHALSRRLMEEQRFKAAMFAYTTTSALYLGGAEPVMLTVRPVTHQLEETLGVQPFVGRGLVADDERVGAEPVVLLEHGFWSSAFGADPTIVNGRIELEGKRYTVIGVMPRGFKFPTYATTNVWTPIHADGTAMGNKVGIVELVGRVREEQLVAAQSQVAVLAARLMNEAAPESKGMSARFESIDRSDAKLIQPIVLLSGAVILILLIAGVNMVNLLLVRGTARTREIAVRLAIGASRARLVRQLGTEAITLALVSGVVAVLIAIVVLRGVSAIMPQSITFFAPFAIALETRALTFAFLLTLICGFVFGLLPAVLATRRARTDANADLTRYATRTAGRTRLRRGLVIAEVALSVTLLVGAGLLIRSFTRLVSIDPGFEPRNLAIVKLNVSTANYPSAAARGAYLRQLEESLESLPGVRAVSLADGVPPHTNITFGALEVEGSASATGAVVLPYTDVRPDFVDVVGARLVMGRIFNEEDDQNSVLVDEDLARAIAGDRNPIGKRFRLQGWEWQTVIGVVKDLKMLGPDSRRADFAMLRPATYDRLGGYMAVAIRTEGDPALLLSSMRKAVRSVDRRQPIDDLLPATTAYAAAIDMPRFLLVLISILASVALVLATVGVYGVLAFGVNQRRHEIGVRMALGARPADLKSMVLREGLFLAVVGTITGLGGALALSRFIRAVLFGVEPNDPATLAAVVATLIAAALLASAIPARRATRVSPLTALRSE